MIPPASMTDVIVLQHTPIEGPGRLGDALAEGGLVARIVLAAQQPVPPELGGARGLVLLGGPMGVHEATRYPFLRDELALVEHALAVGVPILGICLGSQLLATALGARVEPTGHPEIGWLPVTLRREALGDRLFSGLPGTFDALHWHGDAFDLPRGATSLASSARTPHQAFSWGERAWGVLFHVEATPQQVRAMAASFEGELVASGITPGELIAATDVALPRSAELARSLFGAWVSVVREGGQS